MESKVSKIYEWVSRYCTFLVLGGFIRFLVTIVFQVTPWSWYDYALSPLFGLLFYWGLKKLGDESQKEKERR